MLRFLGRSDSSEVAFCDRCASVCDRRCGAQAVRRRIDEQALRNYGWRLA